MKFLIGIVLTCSTLLIMVNTMGQEKEKVSDPQKDGYVPDAETAIKIAEAIWFPIYGKKIYKHKPFKATLNEKGVWIVEGTLHTQKGGVPYAEIQKVDCKVLRVIHTK